MWIVELNAANWNTETGEVDSSLCGTHSWLFCFSQEAPQLQLLQIVYIICTIKETMEETQNAFGWKEMLCFWTSSSTPSAMGSKPDPTWPWTFQEKDIHSLSWTFRATCSRVLLVLQSFALMWREVFKYPWT